MKAGDVFTINSRKLDGTVRRSWTCRFVSQQDSHLIFEGEFESDVVHPDLGHIVAGTRSVEHYWLDRWYNVFRFFEPTGEFRNIYYNINMPPTLSDGALDYVDLDIDIVVWPDGRVVILDESDFEENAATFNYPTELRERVRATLQQIESMLSDNVDLAASHP